MRDKVADILHAGILQYGQECFSLGCIFMRKGDAGTDHKPVSECCLDSPEHQVEITFARSKSVMVFRQTIESEIKMLYAVLCQESGQRSELTIVPRAHAVHLQIVCAYGINTLKKVQRVGYVWMLHGKAI